MVGAMPAGREIRQHEVFAAPRGDVVEPAPTARRGAAAPVRLSPELEKAVLAGVLTGAVDVTFVRPEELSAEGRAVWRAAAALIARGAPLPLPREAVVLHVADVMGADRQAARAYLEAVYASAAAASGAEETLRRVRHRHTLLAVIRTASEQLRRDQFSADEFLEVLAAGGAEPDLRPLGDQLRGPAPDPPPRLAIPSLPKLTERLDGGLIGITALAGEPGVGKSCLAWQIALDVSRSVPVLYYNLDDSTATLITRTVQLFGGDLERARRATSRVCVRDDIGTLGSDLITVPAPALVVVDSLQTLPVGVEFRKAGLDAWIRRFKGLRKRGYYFVLVSEMPRSRYGAPPFVGAFKESGDIEYAADLAWQLTPTGFGAELHVVKNRHGALRGLAATLTRVRHWLWVEE